ncbi:MAG TPA: ATPase domain-containing protein [Chloroflexia bacterium]|nr:ATPase domain-containing protein [Chloroflexia bacterium]
MSDNPGGPSKASESPLERLSTGITGLDRLLQGGLLKGDSYIIMGAPGTGKTTLGNQVAFNHIADGGSAVYLSLMTETHNRMIFHLRQFPFFDSTALGNRMYYISGFSSLEKEGLEGLLNLVRNVIRERKISLLVLDGLSTIEEFSPSGIDFRRFIQGIDSYSEVHGCTILMLTHRNDSTVFHPEYTMVDGIIELSDEIAGIRNERKLQVIKFRGSAFLQGKHNLDITSEGIKVLPRVEALLADITVPSHSEEQYRFGIEKLDEMLHGGLYADTTTMLFGPTGSGKTLLGLNFLADGLAQGQRSLYFGFYESPARLVTKAEKIGLPFSNYLDSGLLEIIWQAPLENDLDFLAAKLFQAVERHKPQRLFIDAFGGFLQGAIHKERLSLYWSALTYGLRALNVTTVFALEMPFILGGMVEIPVEGVSAITENIILVRLAEANATLQHLVSILKLRDNEFDRTINELFISDAGIEVKSLLGANTATTFSEISGGASVSRVSSESESNQSRQSDSDS